MGCGRARETYEGTPYTPGSWTETPSQCTETHQQQGKINLSQLLACPNGIVYMFTVELVKTSAIHIGSSVCDLSSWPGAQGQ